MMRDIGIGDRQDHAGDVLAGPFVEQRLQVDHVRRTIRQMLIVHAVVGGGDDDSTRLVESGQITVDHGVEVIGDLGAGTGLVLDVVRGRQVHQIGAEALHQLHTGREHELRQSGRIHIRHRQADEVHDAVDAVRFLGSFVGTLGREGDGAARAVVETVRQQQAQLILGGDHGHLGPGVVELLQDGRRAQKLRIIHHHFCLGGFVPEEVAGNAMH